MAAQVQSSDLMLSTAGAPKAPIDAQKAHQDPFVPLSGAQRREMTGEFKALLSMGMRRVPLSQWNARDIADCQAANAANDAYCRHCDVQLGNSRGDFFFYTDDSRTCRLENIEITMESADNTLLKDLKPEARAYAGSNAGQFYVEEDDRSGQTNLKFVWKRKP